MVFGTLVLRPRINRIANIALGIVYAVTIIVGAVGEWSYYILGSSIEVALLAAVVYYAWTWPKLPKTSESETRLRVESELDHVTVLHASSSGEAGQAVATTRGKSGRA